MSITFDILCLGNKANLASIEGIGVAQNAGSIVGSMFGSSGDMFYDHIQTLAPGSTSVTASTTRTEDHTPKLRGSTGRKMPADLSTCWAFTPSHSHAQPMTRAARG